ncbi:hypothetical protein HELRODRAFT_160950 [Helobdella robusta]|uniref:Uncharacterized protein n=1 Tax=Helobdella robusta TaxID=6412 RepID=T1EQW8_HELRO|nr:hypothetical protein HELRODRAFT_160950 [Helobdella robusta]ESO01788.1 hypothetical protein HELRODRAFT_160950 [Helobdella robusta]
MPGELSKDERIDDPAKRFKNEIYFATLDTLLMQLEERFHDFCEIVANFHCLDPSQFLADNTAFSTLCAMYDNDINHNEAVLEYETLKNVYESIRSSLPEDLKIHEMQRCGENFNIDIADVQASANVQWLQQLAKFDVAPGGHERISIANES